MSKREKERRRKACAHIILYTYTRTYNAIKWKDKNQGAHVVKKIVRNFYEEDKRLRR